MPDGKRVLVKTRAEPAPAWLPGFAEALAGKRAERQSGSIAISFDGLETLHQRAITNRVDSSDQPWLHWFLGQRLQSPERRRYGEARWTKKTPSGWFLCVRF
jgi:hypothetical protein